MSTHLRPELACERGKRKADERTRTADPFITSEVLYQLSYVGMRREMLAHRQPGRVAWRKLAAAKHGEPIKQALNP